MKINDFSPQVEVSSQLEEQFFSIQDQGMIFDILRNKMYSNPILAICREISCNARDAHREVQKENEPIHICLPTAGEPFYKVRDFGPGISPDRMSNIFIKYTASTKRNDNIQTGGFGLGAKTPFSYSDTFTIITNYNGIRYNYACFIDETKVGKLSLLSESPTKESNGTEIIVPVQQKDFHIFEEYTENCTRYWKVKPVIKGKDLTWKSVTPIMSGDNWSIISSDSWNRGIKLIVDGIEYPVDLNTLRSYADFKIIDAAKGTLLLYFGVGEISLSASREQIYLDASTKQVISKRLNDVYDDVRNNAQDSINNCINFWEANVYYRNCLTQAFHSLGFLGKLRWRNNDLIMGHPDLGCSVMNFVKGKFHRRYGANPDKISRSTGRSFAFANNSALFVNDLGIKELTTKHVKKAFESNPDLTSVQVICPNEKTSVEQLNQQFNLELMEPNLLSSIAKVSKRASKSNTSRLLVFKFDSKVGNFKQSSYSALESDTQHKVLCLLTKDSDQPNASRNMMVNDRAFSYNTLYEIASSHPECSFYGIDSSISAERLEEDFSHLQDFEEFAEEKLINHSHSEYVKIKYLLEMGSSVRNYIYSYRNVFTTAIKDSKSLVLEMLDVYSKLTNLSVEDRKSLIVYESINGSISNEDLEAWREKNPSLHVVKLHEAFDAKYPLLAAISYYEYIEHINHIVDYVNLVDAR